MRYCPRAHQALWSKKFCASVCTTRQKSLQQRPRVHFAQLRAVDVNADTLRVLEEAAGQHTLCNLLACLKPCSQLLPQAGAGRDCRDASML